MGPCRWAYWGREQREGGREGGREGEREQREGEREGGREGGREREREGAADGGREGKRASNEVREGEQNPTLVKKDAPWEGYNMKNHEREFGSQRRCHDTGQCKLAMSMHSRCRCKLDGLT